MTPEAAFKGKTYWLVTGVYGMFTVADRGVSGPWGPQFCGALCKGVTQRFPAGVWGRERMAL